MLIETSQMQRLIVFLGHPTYGLSVVLFALLLSSGIGSYFTQNIERHARRAQAGMRRLGSPDSWCWSLFGVMHARSGPMPSAARRRHSGSSTAICLLCSRRAC